MWFRSLFDALLARPSRTPARPRRLVPSVRRRARAVRPLLEVLEDRALLSTYTVDALTDTGAGSGLTGDLRYCVTNATSGNDTITFAPGLSGTIQLQSALPDLNAGVAIQGPGATRLTMAGFSVNSPIFTVGSAASVQISGLTLADAGDAVENAGALVISYSTLTGNNNAILNSGSLTVNNSTLSGNDAIGYAASGYGTPSGPYGNGGTYPPGDGYGGGIYMAGGTLSINDSTLADNQAVGGNNFAGVTNGTGSPLPGGNGYGGGLYISGGTVSINNSTLADNFASGGGVYFSYLDGSGYGGGIYNAAGPSALRMYDTILAGNSADTAGSDLYGGIASLGHNLIGSTSGGSGFAASDLLNVNPQLGSLQNNGGPTQTLALLPGSPAIDAGDNTSAPAYDQRGPGFPRVVNGAIDIGAFEVQNSNPIQPSSLAVSGFPSVTTAGVAGGFTVTALNANGTTDTGYTGTVHFTSSDARAVLPANYTFTAADAGSHTFSATLKTAGTLSITATDTTTAGITGTDGGITVQPAAASKLVVSGYPSPTTAGASHTFTVTAEDPYGNTATGYAGTVHFTSSDARAVLPANYAFTTADAGTHTFSATLKTAGTQSITATDTTTVSISGTDSGITVKSAAASRFVLTGPSSVTVGVPFRLTLTVLDAYGNVATGYTGTVHFSSTDGTATLPANYTFSATDQGVQTFTGLVLHRKGQQKITTTDPLNSALTASLTEQVA
jgi:hypothetical protein